MSFTYDYPRPALTVDCVIFGQSEGEPLRVLLIERARDPFAGSWAFPGGFVDEGETVEQAALRELEEETSLGNVSMQEVGVFSEPGRDPRGWTVSVAFLALVNIQDCQVAAADDARRAEWHSVDQIEHLAFDHLQILARAREKLHIIYPELSSSSANEMLSRLLYEATTPDMRIQVFVRINSTGGLEVVGVDSGKLVKKLKGAWDYEYYLTLTRRQKEKLKAKLGQVGTLVANDSELMAWLEANYHHKEAFSALEGLFIELDVDYKLEIWN